MRTWRVGTISMGATLVLLGIFLILSQLLNWEPAYVMTSWWPLLFVVLGSEILVYLFLAKKENPPIKYDFLSIFFVGVLGFAGIGFTVMSATGVLEKMNDWMNYEVKTLDLPAYSEPLDDRVKRVVLDVGAHPLTIESGTGQEMSVFGTYRSEILNDKRTVTNSEDYLLTKRSGDTLYVLMKDLPDSPPIFGTYPDMNATIVVPDNVYLEVNANHQSLHMQPRTLHNHWLITHAADLTIQLTDEADILFDTKNIGNIDTEQGEWDLVNEPTEHSEEEQYEPQSGTLQIGEGTYTIAVSNVETLTVSVVE